MSIFWILSPAKVNLFLEILDRRPDGYHNLKTLFAKTSLCDRLGFSPSPSLQVDIHPSSETCSQVASLGKENLVYRAARELQKAFRIHRGAKILLIKRIPLGAGLGGGSSNAAAALKGLCRLWEIPFPRHKKRLLEIACRLGADVPFFLQESPFCLGEGTGERLTPLPCPRSYWAVLIYPGLSVSTPWAYERLRRDRSRRSKKPLNLTREGNLDKLAHSLRRGCPPRVWGSFLFNRLEEVVLPRYPQIQKAMTFLKTQEVPSPLMSGSGSSVLGIVPDLLAGRKILTNLRNSSWSPSLIRIGRRG